jgi:hypothetical protein
MQWADKLLTSVEGERPVDLTLHPFFDGVHLKLLHQKYISPYKEKEVSLIFFDELILMAKILAKI